MSAGTHGSIKSYNYSIPKATLEAAIMQVIKENPNVVRDTSLDILGNSPMLDNSDSMGYYPAGENFYNDIRHYVTIKIKSEQKMYEYTFRYYGADKDWLTSKTSGVFIAYAYDENRNGGSVGNGGIKWSDFKLKQELTVTFERELINKVDAKLGLTHTEE